MRIYQKSQEPLQCKIQENVSITDLGIGILKTGIILLTQKERIRKLIPIEKIMYDPDMKSIQWKKRLIPQQRIQLMEISESLKKILKEGLTLKMIGGSLHRIIIKGELFQS